MADIAESVRIALNANAADLAKAGTEEAVDKLVPKIIKDAENSFSPQSDPWSFRAVILILGIVVVGVMAVYAMHTLTPDQAATATSPARTLRDLPEALIALGSVAVGALAGILAPGPRSSK